MISNLIQYFHSEITVLGFAWLLFTIYLLLNYYLYKTLGENVSPMTAALIGKGYLWKYGIVVGMVFIVAVVVVLLILNLVTSGEITLTFKLLIATFCFYLITVCGLNLWGKAFLKKKGININDNVGWKAFVQSVKEHMKSKEDKRKENILK